MFVAKYTQKKELVWNALVVNSIKGKVNDAQIISPTRIGSVSTTTNTFG